MFLVFAAAVIAGAAFAQPPCNPTQFVGFGPDFGTTVFSSECITVCPGAVTQICVSGVQPGQIPILVMLPGCLPGVTLCDYECPFHPTSIFWFYDPNGWVYDPTTGYYCNRIVGFEPGCLCITYEGFLAAEMGQMAAVAGDGRVNLRWNTLSERDLSSFEITRRVSGTDEVSVAGRVNANNSATGATYTFTDENVTNGRSYRYGITLINTDGSREVTALAAEATPQAAVSAPVEFALKQNYPNPFNPTSRIGFDLPEAAAVMLTVFDLNGREIATLVNGPLTAGAHEVEFNAAGLPSGIYIYRLNAGDFSAARTMLLMK